MNYKVEISEQAENDIADIYSYIRNVLKSQINADSVLERLYSAMKDLSFMAQSYHLYPNEPWHSLGIHYFSSGNYSIFYSIDENDENANNEPTATVIHVAYGRRDLDEVLQN